MQPLWLYLHFPNLQLDSFHTLGPSKARPNEQLEPAQDGVETPVVILDMQHGIVQLNQAARFTGIKPYMGGYKLCHSTQRLKSSS